MAQFARPTADQAVGNWTSTPLWSKINEGSPGDDTEIASADNTSPDNADFNLSSVNDPSSSTGHTLRAEWHKSSAGGHIINAILQLWQGVPDTGTLIATLTTSDIGSSPVTSTYTLTGTEADNITDYSTLYLRLSRQGDTGGNPSTRRSLVADFIELEVPDASAVNSGDGSSSGAATVTGSGGATGAGVGSTSGLATVLAVGAAIFAGTGSIPASATVTGVGESIYESVGTATGISTVSGTGSSTTTVTGASVGGATTTGTGSSNAESTGTSTGSSTASGTGSSVAVGTGSASGSSTVSGAGSTAEGNVVEGDGTSAGISSVSGVGSSTSTTIGVSSSQATVTGVGTAISPSVGASAGTASTTGSGASTTASVGSLAGSATSLGVGSSTAATTGTSAGSAVVSASSSTQTYNPIHSYKVLAESREIQIVQENRTQESVIAPNRTTSMPAIKRILNVG